MEIPFRLNGRTRVTLEDKLDLLMQDTSITRVLEALAEVCEQRAEAVKAKYGDKGKGLVDRWAHLASGLDYVRSEAVRLGACHTEDV